MVLPFTKQQGIHSRYQMLSPQPIATKTLISQDDKKSDDEIPFDGQGYANFMKSLSANNGWKSQEKLSRPKNHTAPPIQKSQSPTESTVRPIGRYTKRASQSVPNLKTVQGVTNYKKANEDQHKKQLKTIEDYMLLCKQEERNLRRVEGDIIRKESNLKVAMRNYENDIYHNQRHQETEAITAEKEEEKIKQHHFIENEKITKERTNKNIGLIHKEKEGDSKVINKLNGLEFKFESIADAIQQKRTEMDSIVKEFEEKLKLKEEEEFRLKKEFANLSIELNMESQKHRVQKKNDKESSNKVSLRNKAENSRRLNELDHKVQAHKERRDKAERSKRRYSQDLHEVIGVMSSQAREDGRRLKDVKVKIEKNTNNMRQSQIKHDLLQMERLGKQSNEKVLAVNARRKEIQDILSQQRKQRNDQTTDEFRMRNLMVNHEIKKQNLDDSIQHLSRVVDRHEDTEHTLYGQVRQLESDRRKQEQNVHSLKQQLLETQKQNKLLLNQTAFRCKQQEIELEQRLLREEADLRKALTEREERIQTLAKYRGSSKEEKYMLEEQRKNQERLHRIERKTNMILETQPIGKQYETVY